MDFDGQWQVYVKSCYKHLVQARLKYPYNSLWKTKMPPRFKVFLWLMLRDSILTKNNQRKEDGKVTLNVLFVVGKKT